MGIIYLLAAKITAVGKMIAMKKCGSRASGVKNSLKINLIRSVGCTAISLIICLISGFGYFGTAELLLSVFSGVANALLLFSWVLCAEKTSLCTVEIFCMIGGVLFPMLISVLLLPEESITLWAIIGGALLIPAACCFYPLKKKKTAKYH